MTLLPDHIEMRRIGFYSESEYDEFGEQAPASWHCGCGSWMRLEWFVSDEDDEDGHYVSASQARKDEFLAEHAECTPVCYKCRTAPVEFVDAWCLSCSENEDVFS